MPVVTLMLQSPIEPLKVRNPVVEDNVVECPFPSSNVRISAENALPTQAMASTAAEMVKNRLIMTGYFVYFARSNRLKHGWCQTYQSFDIVYITYSHTVVCGFFRTANKEPFALPTA